MPAWQIDYWLIFIRITVVLSGSCLSSTSILYFLVFFALSRNRRQIPFEHRIGYYSTRCLSLIILYGTWIYVQSRSPLDGQLILILTYLCCAFVCLDAHPMAYPKSQNLNSGSVRSRFPLITTDCLSYVTVPSIPEIDSLPFYVYWVRGLRTKRC